MFSFIVNLVLIAAFGTMVYIMARALPRVDETGEMRRWKFLKNIPLDRIDQAIQKSLDKLLRRLKIFTLKADNLITRKLNNSDNKL